MFLSAGADSREHPVAMQQYKHLRDVVVSLIWASESKDHTVDEMLERLASTRCEDEVGRARLELSRRGRAPTGGAGN